MKSLKTHQTTNEGWAVLVYSGDRRLICSLNQSHLWLFVSGLCVGMIASLVIFSLQLPRQTAASPEAASPDVNSEMNSGETDTNIITAPLQVD